LWIGFKSTIVNPFSRRCITEPHCPLLHRSPFSGLSPPSPSPSPSPLPHFPPPGPMRIVEEPVTNPADRRAGTPTERFSPCAPLEIVLRVPSDPVGSFGSERPAPSEIVDSRAPSGPGRQPTIDPCHRLAGSPADQLTGSRLYSRVSHIPSLHFTSHHFTSSFRVPLPTPHSPHPTARIACRTPRLSHSLVARRMGRE
jgi:hypothetical protein